MTALTQQEKKVLRLWLLGATSHGIADNLIMDRERVLDLMVVIRAKLDLEPKPVITPEFAKN